MFHVAHEGCLLEVDDDGVVHTTVPLPECVSTGYIEIKQWAGGLVWATCNRLLWVIDTAGQLVGEVEEVDLRRWEVTGNRAIAHLWSGGIRVYDCHGELIDETEALPPRRARPVKWPLKRHRVGVPATRRVR
jgi:hypothetical protein